MHLEGTQQRLGAMPGVFEFSAPRPAGARRTIRKAPFQGLHSSLFVDREHDGFRGRVQVQGGDLRDLFAERGIRAVHPALHAMGAQIALGQHALIAAPTDAVHQPAGLGDLHQVGNGARRAPGALPDRFTRQSDQLQPGNRAELGRRAGARPVNQAWQTVTLESGAPALHGPRMHAHPVGHRRSTKAARAGQDNPCPDHIAVETRRHPHAAFQLGALLDVQRDPAARPSAAGHTLTTSWRRRCPQTFREICSRFLRTDFSGRIRRLDH